MSLKTPKKFLIIPGREPAAKEIRRLHWRLPVHTNAINILLQTSPPWGAYWKTSAFSARKHQLRLDSSRFRKKNLRFRKYPASYGRGLKARANGRNIVGQQHAILLGPTCCVRLHGATTMLVLVAYSLKPVKFLGPCKRTQHCWPATRNIVGPNMLRPFAWNHNNVGIC